MSKFSLLKFNPSTHTNSATPKRVFSLQKRLMVTTCVNSLVIGLLCLVIIVIVVGHDTNELFDDILEEQAALLLADGQRINGQQLTYALDKYHEEFELDYQFIQTNGEVVRKSHKAPPYPFVQNHLHQNRFYNVYYHGTWWRIYSLVQADSNIQIQIAQPWSERYEHLLEAVGHFIWVMLLLVILSMLGTWFAIRKSIKILNHICQQITEKNIQNLSPVQTTELFSEVQPMIDSVNDLLFNLQQAIEKEQQFTADAAHELRTPLAAIQMKLQLLQRKHQQLLSPIQTEWGQLMHDVKRSTAIIENLLLLARLDPRQNQNLPKQSFLIWSMLEDLKDYTNTLLQNKNIKLILDWQIESDCSLYANRELCFTALRNLLDNAVRYHRDKGEIRFAVQLFAGDDLGLDSIKKYIGFLVQDNGTGVDEIQRKQLTQRFHRGLGTGQSGSGLGLSIVQQIVILHQGQLRFSDGISGQGLGVTIYLPLE